MADFLATLRDVNLAGLADGAGIYWDATAKQWKAVPSAWAAYTPVWSASSVAPTLGNGTAAGAYRQIGKTVFFRLSIVFGSTTTYGSGNQRMGLPVGPASSQVCATGLVSNGGSFEGFTPLYDGSSSGGQSVIHILAGTNLLTSADSRLAAGGQILIAGSYEAA